MEKIREQSRQDGMVRFVKLINVILMTIPFAAAWMCYYANRTDSPYYAKGNYLIIAIFAFLYVTYVRIYDGFLISMSKVSEIVYSQGLSAFISNAIMYMITWLLTKHLPAVWPLLLVFVLQL